MNIANKTSQPTYLFYDIESSGLNKCFDQVLQFAAIRTDLQLNEIERYELKIKPNCDVLPAPGAIVTHYLSPDSLQDGLAEIEALEKIHAWMNQPGTISLGYNTLTFDVNFYPVPF
jgi:exodeoxyribonuclease-1